MDDSEVDLIFRKNLNKQYLFFVEKYCRQKKSLFFVILSTPGDGALKLSRPRVTRLLGVIPIFTRKSKHQCNPTTGWGNPGYVFIKNTWE